ncbi:hypothetical protein [Carboxydothermus pertinax]|uniref:Uncharacterized protein n=1 Tax=Carboxydothermus pertinax TaxID=870242 RepID=A0A1L8CRS1_9THEO|nr:hypothetical protein [Carboxydothermus pertinax]GAV21564.1 hypothetical protein cpu_00740 [Carboxydothermus pertinax]
MSNRLSTNSRNFPNQWGTNNFNKEFHEIINNLENISYNENNQKYYLILKIYNRIFAMYNEIIRTKQEVINAHNNIFERYAEISNIEQAASKEVNSMDWQEKYLDKLDRDISDMKASLRATEERVAQMISQTLSEMRDRDNQRHQEFLTIKTDIADTKKWFFGIIISVIIGFAGLIYANHQFLSSLAQLITSLLTSNK